MVLITLCKIGYLVLITRLPFCIFSGEGFWYNLPDTGRRPYDPIAFSKERTGQTNRPGSTARQKYVAM